MRHAGLFTFILIKLTLEINSLLTQKQKMWGTCNDASFTCKECFFFLQNKCLAAGASLGHGIMLHNAICALQELCEICDVSVRQCIWPHVLLLVAEVWEGNKKITACILRHFLQRSQNSQDWCQIPVIRTLTEINDENWSVDYKLNLIGNIGMHLLLKVRQDSSLLKGDNVSHIMQRKRFST